MPLHDVCIHRNKGEKFLFVDGILIESLHFVETDGINITYEDEKTMIRRNGQVVPKL